MGQNTTNTTAFIEAQQYSKFILENLHDALLPDSWSRDVTDFGEGTTLNIKTVGSVTLQEAAEEIELNYNPIDTGTVTLGISEYPGDAWSITDDLREDGSQIDTLHAMRAMESTRALQEYFETKFFSACNAAQTDADPNNVNGFAHRYASTETNNVIALNHFRDMKLAFDKANSPQAGRVAIVDPVVEATINGLVTQTSSTNYSYNPQFNMAINEGFAMDHKFVMNIMGWDIYTSNRLPTGSFGDGTTTVTGGVANIFMNVLDDNTRPIMRAWRRMPQVEYERNMKKRRDEFQVTARFGLGAQRLDTLATVITSATDY